MFVSFFPRPKLFFWSAVVWAALAMAFWYAFAGNLVDSSSGVIGVALFWSAPSLWFDLYFAICVALFSGAWMWFSPHPWAPWSIIGSAPVAGGQELIVDWPVRQAATGQAVAFYRGCDLTSTTCRAMGDGDAAARRRFRGIPNLPQVNLSLPQMAQPASGGKK